jgi:hypothetical protein
VGRVARAEMHRARRSRGTEVSNPAPSSAESCANPTSSERGPASIDLRVSLSAWELGRQRASWLWLTIRRACGLSTAGSGQMQPLPMNEFKPDVWQGFHPATGEPQADAFEEGAHPCSMGLWGLV